MADDTETKPVIRYARIAPLYKALIWTSFVVNAILIIVVAVLAVSLWNARNQLAEITQKAQVFAGANVHELQSVIAELEDATIIYTVELRGASLPIELQVPINQATRVVLTDDVPLSVPAAILFPSGGGNLNASVNINLPAGMELPIALDFQVPLETSVPVNLDVPVNIPLRETELGPQFERLGKLVDGLVTPVEDLIIRPKEEDGEVQADH